jgi:hypothetical protein
MRSIVNPAPFVVDQSVSGSFVGSLRLPPHAEEHPKPLILCWRLEALIVTSEDCAAPPPHVPDPPSTPTVCTAPPSVVGIPPSGPIPPEPLPLPELDPAPELDAPPEVEPPLEPFEPIEPEEFPELDPLELDPLPELVTLPESEAPTSPGGELPAVELLLHAPAIATSTRHPVIAERGRTPVLAAAMITPSLSRSGSHRRNPLRKVRRLEWIQRRQTDPLRMQGGEPLAAEKARISYSCHRSTGFAVLSKLAVKGGNLMSFAKSCFAVAAFVVSMGSAMPRAGADELKYGVVVSFDGHVAVIRTQNSEGHWRVDGTTAVSGPIQTNDWVAADVETSGHLKSLRSEMHATPMTGVVKTVKGEVLAIASGTSTQNWNVVPTTGVTGVEKGAISPGDELSLDVYSNHNIASLRFIRHVK